MYNKFYFSGHFSTGVIELFHLELGFFRRPYLFILEREVAKCLIRVMSLNVLPNELWLCSAF